MQGIKWPKMSRHLHNYTTCSSLDCWQVCTTVSCRLCQIGKFLSRKRGSSDQFWLAQPLCSLSSKLWLTDVELAVFFSPSTSKLLLVELCSCESFLQYLAFLSSAPPRIMTTEVSFIHRLLLTKTTCSLPQNPAHGNSVTYHFRNLSHRGNNHHHSHPTWRIQRLFMTTHSQLTLLPLKFFFTWWTGHWPVTVTYSDSPTEPRNTFGKCLNLMNKPFETTCFESLCLKGPISVSHHDKWMRFVPHLSKSFWSNFRNLYLIN